MNSERKTMETVEYLTGCPNCKTMLKVEGVFVCGDRVRCVICDGLYSVIALRLGEERNVMELSPIPVEHPAFNGEPKTVI